VAELELMEAAITRSRKSWREGSIPIGLLGQRGASVRLDRGLRGYHGLRKHRKGNKEATFAIFIRVIRNRNGCAATAVLSIRGSKK
jgi:hypothetical protein